MNLKTVYQGIQIGNLGQYPSHELKTRFGLRGVGYCRGAAKLAGATFKKGYPYYNEGGVAVLGEVYAYIQHPNGVVLEIILAESCPYYRTNGMIMANGGLTFGYGPNIRMMDNLESWTEEKLAGVIRKFLQG
jgi:hypothetical protein